MKILLTLLIVILLEPVRLVHQLINMGITFINQLKHSENEDVFSFKEKFSFFDTHRFHNN